MSPEDTTLLIAIVQFLSHLSQSPRLSPETLSQVLRLVQTDLFPLTHPDLEISSSSEGGSGAQEEQERHHPLRSLQTAVLALVDTVYTMGEARDCHFGSQWTREVRLLRVCHPVGP